MQISVRRATIADAAEIARVHVDTWKTGYAGIVPQTYLDSLNPATSAEMWNGQLVKGDASILVTEDAGQVCGFVAGGPLRGVIGDCDAEIYAIYVLAEFQRSGIGRALLSAIGDALAARGLFRPSLWVLAENPARAFYAHMGGQSVAEKEIEIGGKALIEVAYAWESVDDLRSDAKR